MTRSENEVKTFSTGSEIQIELSSRNISKNRFSEIFQKVIKTKLWSRIFCFYRCVRITSEVSQK